MNEKAKERTFDAIRMASEVYRMENKVFVLSDIQDCAFNSDNETIGYRFHLFLAHIDDPMVIHRLNRELKAHLKNWSVEISGNRFIVEDQVPLKSIHQTCSKDGPIPVTLRQ